MKACVAKDARDRPVVTLGVKLALVIAPTEVQAEGDSGMVADDRVVHLDGKVEQPIGIVAALPVSFPQRWVE